MLDNSEKLKIELRLLYSSEYEASNLEGLFDGSDEGIETVQKLIKERKAKNIIDRLEKCAAGHAWKEFEDICLDLVKLTLEQNEFSEAPALSQLSSKYVPLDVKGVRKDIVIPLNPKRPENFDNNLIWDRFRNTPYLCNYLIFDAKNYNGPITDREIFQMYHYLSPQRGKVGIIFSRKNSVDKTGKAALRRIKEDDYIVFVLTDIQIKEWVECYLSDGHVRIFFTNLLTKYEHSF